MKFTASCCSLGLLLAGFFAGCSGIGEDKWTQNRPPVYPVSGVVTYNGQPLSGATVVFSSTGAEPISAVSMTDDTGKYQLRTFEEGDGAVAGEHQILVTAVETSGPPPGANLDEVDPTITEKSRIPARYNDFAKSGLTATVKAEAQNIVNLELND